MWPGNNNKLSPTLVSLFLLQAVSARRFWPEDNKRAKVIDSNGKKIFSSVLSKWPSISSRGGSKKMVPFFLYFLFGNFLEVVKNTVGGGYWNFGDNNVHEDTKRLDFSEWARARRCTDC